MSGMAMDWEGKGRGKRTKGTEGEEIRLGDCAASERNERQWMGNTKQGGVGGLLAGDRKRGDDRAEQQKLFKSDGL